VSCTARNR